MNMHGETTKNLTLHLCWWFSLALAWYLWLLHCVWSNNHSV